MESKRGLFVAIEGPNGCGKTSLRHALEDELERRNFPHTMTREVFLEENRERVSAGCYTASVVDRAIHAHSLITPLLKQNKTVITERYAMSGVAHASDGFHPSRLEDQFAVLPIPDLWIVLTCEPRLAHERMVKRDGSQRHTPSRTLEIHENYRVLTSMEKGRGAKVLEIDTANISTGVAAVLAASFIETSRLIHDEED